jgi:hypothetical protein
VLSERRTGKLPRCPGRNYQFQVPYAAHRADPNSTQQSIACFNCESISSAVVMLGAIFLVHLPHGFGCQ